MINENDILKLKKQLLPTGRAFNCAPDSNFETLLLGGSTAEATAFNDSLNIIEGLFSDNDNFLESDCERWENIFGIYSSVNDTLANRKLAIMRRMAFFSNVKGRQSKVYLQYALQLAGFDCYIFEYDYIKDKITTIAHANNTFHSNSSYLGSSVIPSHTGYIMNCVEQSEENDLVITNDNLKTMFWIAGADFSYFEVPIEREIEFRNIVLRIKPLHTIAILRQINANTLWILDAGTWNSAAYWTSTGIWKTA
jgi:uncharacterized protein YmfQ (DUF2313 family)